MAVGNGNPGASRLAKVISGRSQQYAEDIKDELILDFGTIGTDMSLRTYTFPVSIPKGQYMVLRHVGGLSFLSKSASVGDHGSHSHTIAPTTIKKGDKVLVAWVNKEPVVLGVVVSSKNL